MTTIDPKNWVLAPVFVPKFRATSTATEFSGNDETLVASEQTNQPPAEEQTFEQIPHKSYAQVVGHSTESKQTIALMEPMEKLCPYTRSLESDLCPYGDECQYVHGDLCDMCGLYCLTADLEQRKMHQNVSDTADPVHGLFCTIINPCVVI